MTSIVYSDHHIHGHGVILVTFFGSSNIPSGTIAKTASSTCLADSLTRLEKGASGAGSELTFVSTARDDDDPDSIKDAWASACGPDIIATGASDE